MAEINDEPVQEEQNGNEKAVIDDKEKTKTPVLDTFGRDLTKLAAEGKLEPVIGREKEIERMIQILSRKKKNNPVLIGHSGVGKTAIAEGLAMRIANKDVTRALHDKRLVLLDLSLLVAGTKFRGQFEERMKVIMEEVERNGQIILFIDEIHTIMGAGNANGSLDASNMIKPALAKGTMRLIGATTFDEYKTSIEKDGAAERRFQKVQVNEPSVEETIQILTQSAKIYEEHHNVSYTPGAIKTAVELADRYLTSRYFPDKAFDIIDEAGSRSHLDNMRTSPEIQAIEAQMAEVAKEKETFVKQQRYEDAARIRDREKALERELQLKKLEWEALEKANRVEVTEDTITTVVSKMIDIPITKLTQDEGEKLIKMPQELESSVIGQNEAVRKVCESIQRNRAGLNDPNKPIASFLFLGSTGIGKTQLAKKLAQYLFNDVDSLIRFDMSEFAEPHTIAQLKGSPPGYVGYEEGGQLTEKVRQKPYSVILFDEIEKAHPLIYNLLLQILDEGKLTDGKGLTVNFKNTIIIMTSNIGTTELSQAKGLGFGIKGNDIDIVSVVTKALKKNFKPEFINRLDETIIFNRLTQEDIFEITKINLKDWAKFIEKQGYKIEVTPELQKFIGEKGYSDEFGARPINRVIKDYIQTPVAKELLLKHFVPGDTILVDLNSNKKNDKEDDVIVTKKAVEA